MTDLFRSAFNYLSSGTTINASSTSVNGREQHPLVGTNVEVGGLKLRVRSLIAEG